MKPTLLILAAGMGSRYGGLKQMDALGPNNETIIDFSVFDAINAGFGKVVFIIRESFAEPFKARFEPILKGKIETEYVFQELNKLPAGFTVPEGREKPWGTGHAILMAKDVIREPFAIINADDFYGKVAYTQVANFISNSINPNEYGMVGYYLRNTLSDFGTVSRGVCATDAQGNMVNIIERTKIGKEDGKIFYYEENDKIELTGNEPVSMNFWAFKPSYFNFLEEGFVKFLQERGNELKSEYYFNAVVDKLIKEKRVTTKVINTEAPWFGVTYQEDRPIVQNKIKELMSQGEYPLSLWH